MTRRGNEESCVGALNSMGPTIVGWKYEVFTSGAIFYLADLD